MAVVDGRMDKRPDWTKGRQGSELDRVPFDSITASGPNRVVERHRQAPCYARPSAPSHLEVFPWDAMLGCMNCAGHDLCKWSMSSLHDTGERATRI